MVGLGVPSAELRVSISHQGGMRGRVDTIAGRIPQKEFLVLGGGKKVEVQRMNFDNKTSDEKRDATIMGLLKEKGILTKGKVIHCVGDRNESGKAGEEGLAEIIRQVSENGIEKISLPDSNKHIGQVLSGDGDVIRPNFAGIGTEKSKKNPPNTVSAILLYNTDKIPIKADDSRKVGISEADLRIDRFINQVAFEYKNLTGGNKYDTLKDSLEKVIIVKYK